MNAVDFKKRETKIKKKTTLYHETQKTIKSLIITLGVMITALGVLFIMTTNLSAQQGYSLQQEKLKNEELKSVNSSLKAKITSSAAFSALRDDTLLKKMEQMSVKQFLTREDNEVK